MGRGARSAPRPIFTISISRFVCVYICFDMAKQIFQTSPTGCLGYFKHTQQGVEDIRNNIWITLLRLPSLARMNFLNCMELNYTVAKGP